MCEQVGEAIEIIAKLQKGGKVSRHVNNQELPHHRDIGTEGAAPSSGDFNSQGGGGGGSSTGTENEDDDDDDDFQLGEMIGEEETMVLSSPMLPLTTKKKSGNNKNGNNNNNNASSSYADVLAQQKQQQQLNDSQWKSINQFLGVNNYDMAFQIGMNSLNVNAANQAKRSDSGSESFIKLLTTLEPKQVLGNLSSNTVNDLYRGIANILSAAPSSSSVTAAASAVTGDKRDSLTGAGVKGSSSDECMQWLVALTRPRPKSQPSGSNALMQSKSLSQLSATAGSNPRISRLSSSSSSSSLPCCQELNPEVVISIISAIDASYINNLSGSGQQQQPPVSVNDQKAKGFALLLKSVLTKQLQLQSSESYSG